MPLARRPLLASAATLAACAWSAQAAAAPFPLAVAYQAPASCPAQAAFERELAERELSFRPPAPGEQATELKVSLSLEEGRAHGALELRLLSGDSTHRELQAATCDDLVRSLALIASLALAPIAAGPAPAPPPRAPAPAAPAPTPTPAPPAGTAPRTTAPDQRLAVGLGLAGALGLLPGLAPGLLAWVERRTPATALGLGASYWLPSTTTAGPFRAHFSALLLELTPCLRLRAWASACGGLQGGMLMARGQDIDNPTSVTRSWVAARLGVRAAIEAYPGRRVEAHLWGFLPVIRDAFVFEQPRIEVYKPPPVGVGASVGGGFDFF